MREFKVMEFKVGVLVKQPIPVAEVNTRLSSLIDLSFGRDERSRNYHESKDYKFYCFGGLKPIRKEVYNKGKYTLLIRTVDELVLKLFKKSLKDLKDDYLEVLDFTVKEVQQEKIFDLTTVTPVIMKNKEGYIQDEVKHKKLLEERIKINLIKKWRMFTGSSARAEDFYIFQYLNKTNKFPISVAYKGITLLGDKVKVKIPPTKEALSLAYFALGVGLGEMNSRGCGFVVANAGAKASKPSNKGAGKKNFKNKGGFKGKGSARPHNNKGGYKPYKGNNGQAHRSVNK